MFKFDPESQRALRNAHIRSRCSFDVPGKKLIVTKAPVETPYAMKTPGALDLNLSISATSPESPFSWVGTPPAFPIARIAGLRECSFCKGEVTLTLRAVDGTDWVVHLSIHAFLAMMDRIAGAACTLKTKTDSEDCDL